MLELLEACKVGGMGYSANILLHNAAGILREFAKGHENEETLLAISERLRLKGEQEWKAVHGEPFPVVDIPQNFHWTKGEIPSEPTRTWEIRYMDGEGRRQTAECKSIEEAVGLIELFAQIPGIRYFRVVERTERDVAAFINKA